MTPYPRTTGGPTALILLLTPALLWTVCAAGAPSNSSTAPTHIHLDGNPAQCPGADFCIKVSRCCQLGVDEQGWVAAAVGWSLWFITLILLCVDKLVKLPADEPKDLQA
ncbi:transmembrane protein 213 [Ornithorhynchus anatinus]|uniref:transmembrane protein 213 n=1 Tax=Ornithorhynchus anatinus TaxID=9258 RepID=UPI0004545AAD|nr:transmembrane protein 213 [Ornithorhynchus anatinus]